MRIVLYIRHNMIGQVPTLKSLPTKVWQREPMEAGDWGGDKRRRRRTCDWISPEPKWPMRLQGAGICTATNLRNLGLQLSESLERQIRLRLCQSLEVATQNVPLLIWTAPARDKVESYTAAVQVDSAFTGVQGEKNVCWDSVSPAAAWLLDYPGQIVSSLEEAWEERRGKAALCVTLLIAVLLICSNLWACRFPVHGRILWVLTDRQNKVPRLPVFVSRVLFCCFHWRKDS